MDMVAGGLGLHQDQWSVMFRECWATFIVHEGYIPEWSSTPPLRRTPISQRRYGSTDLNMFSHEISELLKIKAIQEMDPEEPCFVSNLFMVPKKGGSLRPVIDLRKLNTYVKYSHFKMEGIDLVKSLVRREDFMVSIDLNQAFYHVPVLTGLRKFFTFDFMGKRYCFNCLPFGFTASPRIFTKILRPIIKLA